jgi:hypothetical protein
MEVANMAISLANGKGKVVYGHSLAHAKVSASQKALLAAQSARGEVLLALSAAQLAKGIGVSAGLVSRAGKLQANPALEAEVNAGRLSVAKAVKLLGAAAKSRQPKQLQPALTLFELFAAATRVERAECMAAFVDEALSVLDDTTVPIGSVMSDNDLFIPHHL